MQIKRTAEGPLIPHFRFTYARYRGVCACVRISHSGIFVSVNHCDMGSQVLLQLRLTTMTAVALTPSHSPRPPSWPLPPWFWRRPSSWVSDTDLARVAPAALRSRFALHYRKKLAPVVDCWRVMRIHE